MWHGWSRGMSFGTNLGQNTIRKNKMTRKMTAQTSKPWRSYFLMWHSRREADHCADSAFPYLYYRRQHADCQAPKGIAFCRFLWYPCLQERRCFVKRRRLCSSRLCYIVLWNEMSMGGRFLKFSSRCSSSKGGMPHDSCWSLCTSGLHRQSSGAVGSGHACHFWHCMADFAR